MITASRRSCGNFPCSQQQRKSSWSLLWRAWPPCFQISAGMPSPPAALPLFSCLMALVISSRVGSSSSSGLTVCWGMCRIALSWTVRFALKRAWKCSDQRSKIDALSVRSFPFTERGNALLHVTYVVSSECQRNKRDTGNLYVLSGSTPIRT